MSEEKESGGQAAPLQWEAGSVAHGLSTFSSVNPGWEYRSKTSCLYLPRFKTALAGWNTGLFTTTGFHYQHCSPSPRWKPEETLTHYNLITVKWKIWYLLTGWACVVKHYRPNWGFTSIRLRYASPKFSLCLALLRSSTKIKRNKILRYIHQAELWLSAVWCWADSVLQETAACCSWNIRYDLKDAIQLCCAKDSCRVRWFVICGFVTTRDRLEI